MTSSRAKMMITATMISPRSDTPRCPMRMAGRLAERAEAAQFPEVEPDEECLADDVGVGHESPDPAVARIVTVVTHHEVMSGWNGARHARHIVVAILDVRKRARLGHEGRGVVLDHDLVLAPVQGFQVAARILHALARQVILDLP